MIDIKEILGDEYMKKFRVFHPQTLFEPFWENLREKRCPLCGNKLKFPLKLKIAMCASKKHGKPFVITLKIFDKLK